MSEYSHENSPEKLSQPNPEHSFDPSHLRDSGDDNMGVGSGVELSQEPELEMEM